MTTLDYESALEATKFILSLLPVDFPRPQIGIICGSGLGGLVSDFHANPQVTIPYATIPHFHVSTVPGHKSELVFATIGNDKKPVVAMVGRLHFYEGHSMQQITFPIRVFHLLGIKTLIGLNLFFALTNL
jgi:purine-nucleoside phosphorylase